MPARRSSTTSLRTPEAGGTRPGPRFAPVLVAVALAVVAVRTFVAAPYTVGSTSMEPTLRAGAVVVVDKATPRWSPPGHGEVVVVRVDGELSVKRVVGLAGDEVAIVDAVLTVDGLPVSEPYVDRTAIDGVYFGPVLVPSDAVLVMGDNRFGSVDSRTYGPVPLDAVVGRVLGH